MRVIGDIPHPQYKITLFAWNGKYLVKIEAGPYEQTYKVSETDVFGDDVVKSIINEEFLNAVTENFKHMHSAWHKALEEM